MKKGILILTISVCLTSCIAQKVTTAKRVVPKTMNVKFVVPAENDSIVSYVLSRSITGKYWSTVKTIPANKRPSVYQFDIASSYGYYRVRTNKKKGYFFSKNLYVNK